MLVLRNFGTSLQSLKKETRTQSRYLRAFQIYNYYYFSKLLVQNITETL